MPADSHCHLNDPAFDEDLETVTAKLEAARFDYILNVGYDITTSKKAITLAGRYPYMYASVGMHPHNAATADDKTLAMIDEMAADPRVVAIGETGLDYFRDRSPREDQQKSLVAHIVIAKKHKKPVVIHCRDAMADCIKILKEENIEETGGVMHCFGGEPKDIRPLLDLGLYISFAGNITYPKATPLREALKLVPGHRLLIETDAPYLSPQKKRGKRNEPLFLPYTLEKAAEVRGFTQDDMERVSVTNFRELFLRNDEDKGSGEVAYKIRNSLYLNVTMSCTNECYFCVRFHSDSVQGHNLRLKEDPTSEEMIEAVGDPTQYDEIVFCGYGEPTLRLDRILEVATTLKSKGATVRLNTNGHGSHIAGRNIAPELVGLVNEVSVSLNAADAKTYDKICLPMIPNAWETTVEFIRSAKLAGINVTATVVEIPGDVDLEAARIFAEDDLGVSFRIRHFDLTG